MYKGKSMDDVIASWSRVVGMFFPLVLIALNLSCSLPSYDSPAPGVIEVRLKTISTKIPFLPLNNFTVKVSSVVAKRSDGAELTILEDVKAIAISDHTYNTLDSSAYFGRMVLGSAYAPAGKYAGIFIQISPSSMIIEDGYRNIAVDKGVPFNDYFQNYKPYTIRAGDTTRVYLTLDLDNGLQKGADKFYFLRQYLYISSIQ